MTNRAQRDGTMVSMQLIMIIGRAVAALGLILLAVSTRWVKSWGNRYATTGVPTSCAGWALLVLGLGLILGPAYLSGQIG